MKHVLKKYKLTGDPAWYCLTADLNGADTDNTLYNGNRRGQDWKLLPKASGISASRTTTNTMRRTWIIYDAL